MYTTFQKFGSLRILFLNKLLFSIKQECIIKSDSKDIYNVTKDLYFSIKKKYVN